METPDSAAATEGASCAVLLTSLVRRPRLTAEAADAAAAPRLTGRFRTRGGIPIGIDAAGRGAEEIDDWSVSEGAQSARSGPVGQPAQPGQPTHVSGAAAQGVAQIALEHTGSLEEAAALIDSLKEEILESTRRPADEGGAD